MQKQNSILIHACCAPCSAPALVRLEGCTRAIFFYNPNIYPEEEYRMRLEEMRKVAQYEGVDLIVGPYDHETWLESAHKWKDEPERGRRCLFCYRERLKKCAEAAKERGFDSFATTLTLSPHKDAGRIDSIGRDVAEEVGVEYYESDFKKKDGYNYSIRFSREHGLKRQDYCGCEFSIRVKKQG